MQSSFLICRLFGVPIRAHWTMLLLPLLFLYQPLLRVRVAPNLFWIGFREMLCLIVGVVSHELAHALTARAHGIGAEAITLWPLGGFTQLSASPATPAADILISLSGPLCNLALGGLAYALSAAASPSIRPWAHVFAYWNLLVGAFNLIPAFPMDGGQALRAALRTRTSRARADLWAGRIGVVAAACIVLLGLAWQSVFVVFVGILTGASSWRLIQENRFASAPARPRVPEAGDFRAWRLSKRDLDDEIRRQRAARRADAETRARIDRILQQISEQGIDSLDDEDRSFLAQASRRIRDEKFGA